MDPNARTPGLARIQKAATPNGGLLAEVRTAYSKLETEARAQRPCVGGPVTTPIRVGRGRARARSRPLYMAPYTGMAPYMGSLLYMGMANFLAKKLAMFLAKNKSLLFVIPKSVAMILAKKKSLLLLR